ncbi:MAG: hypothetical protein H6712_05180 [Myxococcales bacterium]|nr:hypothetical protein [Myxococcales bacterium]MCB9713225.1 hypothetical protein [Myxococcales bacterium]
MSPYDSISSTPKVPRVLALGGCLWLMSGCPSDPEPGSSESGQGSSTSEAATEGADTSTGGGEGSGSGGAADTSTGGVPGCHELTSSCSERHSTFGCGLASPCASLEVEDPSLNDFGMGPITFVNADAATCIAQSLRDGEPGLHRILVEPGQQYSRRHELELLSDGSIITRSEVFDDKCIDYLERWEQLRPPAHFEGCLAEATDEAVLACLLDAGDDAQCIEAAAVCP